MEDINAMIESSNPEYCEQKTLQFQTVLKIMPGDILDYGTMLLDFAVYVKRMKMLIQYEIGFFFLLFFCMNISIVGNCNSHIKIIG